MKLYRRIDENGMFIEDVLLDEVPYLTETVTETITNEDGTTEEIQVERIAIIDILDENGEVISQEPVISPYYIEKPCEGGFYHPKWDFELCDWVEGGIKPEPQPKELTDIEKLKLRQDATENALLFLMDMGGML